MKKLWIIIIYIGYVNSFINNKIINNINNKLFLTKRSQLYGYPKPRKLYKKGNWYNIFDEEIEKVELGKPCKKLTNDIIQGKRRLRFTLKKTKKQMYATIVDDITHDVLCFVSTNFKCYSHIFGTIPTKQFGYERNKGGTIKAAYELGKLIGKQALSKGISKVYFDRNHYKYHGRVEALAIGARKVGLDF
uniref:Ribosomal protein L18, putative n=1 Tax=Theileria annulata TaxID=5874 RepID=A0A3B0N814_THEAN